MQLKKQVNNKIRKILKNSKWIQIPNFNPLCGVGEGVFPSSIVLSCQALRGISQLIEGVKRPPSNFPHLTEETPHCVRGDDMGSFGWSWRRAKPSSNIGDSSQNRLGVTHFGTRASPPFQLFPKGINSFLGTVLESLFAH